MSCVLALLVANPSSIPCTHYDYTYLPGLIYVRSAEPGVIPLHILCAQKHWAKEAKNKIS